MSDAAAVNERVRASFAPVAANYRASRRHGDPGPLREMLVLLAPRGDERVLDLATGGGHTAAALAPFVASIVASDLLPEMLREAGELFREALLENAALALADVHALPFSDGAFDLVTCRFAPHHFADVGAACAEVARVLRPGGRYYVNDCGAPEDHAAAAWVNAVERVRDPSHVRALSRTQWETEVEAAGLRVLVARELPSVYDVPAWMDHLALSEERRREVLERLSQAPRDLPQPLAVDLTPGRERFASLRVEVLALRP